MNAECEHAITAVAGSLDRRWLYECGRCGQWLSPQAMCLDALRRATWFVLALDTDAAASAEALGHGGHPEEG